MDRVVALLSGRTRTQVAKLIAAGGVRLSGVPVSAGSRRVKSDEILETDLELLEEAASNKAQPAAVGEVVFGVVYEDQDVIVVDKPPGLVVHPDATHESGTLASGLLASYPELSATSRARLWRVGPARDRPPFGQRHLGSARCRSKPAGLPGPDSPAGPTHDAAQISRFSVRDTRGRRRRRGRPYRAVSSSSHSDGSGCGRARGRARITACWRAFLSLWRRAIWRCASRRGAPIKSGFTWPP